jgi:hypothetical protein
MSGNFDMIVSSVYYLAGILIAAILSFAVDGDGGGDDPAGSSFDRDDLGEIIDQQFLYDGHVDGVVAAAKAYRSFNVKSQGTPPFDGPGSVRGARACEITRALRLDRKGR